MIQTVYKHFLLTAVLALGITMGFSEAYAQDGLALKVQPSQIDEIVDPGQSAEGVLTVTNANGGRQTYFISTRNVVDMDDSGRPNFENENITDGLEAASWIHPQIEEVTLDVGESIEVPYRIDVPTDASPGSYFAAFFVTREAEAATESGAGVGFHVVSLVNLRVSGVVNDDMLFREFYTDKSLYSGPDVTFVARVDNTGTIHQRPQGIITVTDMLGNEAGRVTFNDSLGAVLPKNDRVFETSWKHDGFALGRYTAMASVVVGDSQKKTLTREVSFWILPMKEIGIVFASIVGLLLLVVIIIRRYIRSVLKRAGHDAMPKIEKQQVSLARKMIRTITWLIVLLALLLIGLVVFSS